MMWTHLVSHHVQGIYRGSFKRSVAICRHSFVLLADGVGRINRRFLISFSECPQLAVKRADAGVSNPRDLWGAPAVALRFAGAIGLIPGLY